ncbi:hypothetical protein HOF40_01600 [Candidatus Parcubacteria bacterium]|jgi:capsular polysaccharide biosynthesis protein|nr:hypothetical protein [Candidatus Parcubacteria bacterium]MBT3948760.1 hypothetical protein [Candidatus Parcubacteria bacterium]
MLHNSPLYLLKKRWKFILVVGIILGVLSGIVTMLFPLSYRADAQVLIISKSRYGVDPYTVVRSAERVGENIAQVMRTNDFYNKVKDQKEFAIDWSRFDERNEREKRKLWNKTMSPSVVYGTGVLNVSTYHPDGEQAALLAGAAVNALSAKGWEYVGGDVTIKVINEPIVTQFPVRPNAILNILLGFMVGVLLSGLVVVKK